MVRAIGTYTITEVYDGRGLSYVNYFYKATSNQTQPAASSITDTSIPSLNSTNKYLWQKQVQYYNSLLPQAYTQLDYIETTGNSWIDTGISPNTNTQWELKFRAINSSTPFYGSFTTNQRFRIDNNSAGLGTKWKNFPGTGGAPVVGDDYVVIWDSKRLSISINGDESILNTTAFTNNINIYLFAQNNNAEGTNRSTGASRLYYSKLTQDNELVRNFIPCKRNSDNVLGLYDTVDGVFYTNDGTGTFTAGPVSEQDYDEVITLVAVCGDDGTNAIQSFLSNESHTLPADSSGTPTTYAGAETYMYVYEGSQDVTSQYNFSRNASSGITSTISGNKVTVTGVSNGTGGTITITATKGSTTLTKVFNISISKAGTNGTSVTITTKNVTYQLGDSGTTAPTGSWLVSVPNLEPTKYLWTKTYVKYSDNTENISYSVSYIARDGTNGQTGPAGRGILSTTVEYQKSTSGTTVPTGTWKPTIGDVGTIGPGEYLWTRTTTSYTSGNDSVGYSVGMMGVTGAVGTGIDSITEQYYLSTSKTTQTGGSWVDSPPAWQNGKYIWTRSKIVYKNPASTVYTTPLCSSEWEAVNNIPSYIASRGENLITNGTALLLDNTNFPALTYDGSDTYYASGCFKGTGYKSVATDEYIPVDVNDTYELSYYIKVDSEGVRYYDFIQCYDIDKNNIGDGNVMYVPGSLTTLSQELKNGDTVVHFTDMSGFKKNYNGNYSRKLIFWDYKNSQGYTYLPETYSRHVTGTGMWEDNNMDFENNTITLKSAWTYGTYPAGTQVSQGNNGANMRYLNAYYTLTPDVWTHKTGKISKVAKNNGNGFREGTAYIKPGWWFNYNNLVPASTTKLSTVTFTRSPGISTSVYTLDVEYYLSTSNSTPTGGSWSTTAPNWEDGKFMWSRQKVTYGDGSTVTRNQTCIAGARGSTGSGIVSIEEEFYLSNSKSTPTGGSWVTTSPTWSSGKYIWTRSKITYSNPTSVDYTEPLCDSSWEAVNNIKIGGTNLIKNGSGKEKKGFFNNFTYDQNNELEVVWNLDTTSTVKYATTSLNDGFVIPINKYIPGETYTWSYDIMYTEYSGVTSISEKAIGQRYTTGGQVSWQRVTEHDLPIGSSYVLNTWYHIERKVVIPSTNYPQTGAGIQNTLRIGYTSSNGGRIRFKLKNVKLEKGNIATDWSPAPEDVNSQFDAMTTYVNSVRDDLQGQIDGAIQFWNGPDVPTLNNYPANQWTTEDERTAHQADIYTVIIDVSGELKQGKGYRFDKVNGNWVWVEITDQEMSAVQALAASKAKVFVTTPTVPYSVGDLWLKDGELWKCKTAKDTSGSYALSDWEVATDYTDDAYAQQVQQNLDNLQVGGTNLAYKGTVDSYNSDATVVNISNFRNDGSFSVARPSGQNGGALLDRYIDYIPGNEYIISFKMKAVENTIASFYLWQDPPTSAYRHKNSKVYVDGSDVGTLREIIPFPNDLDYHDIIIKFTAADTIGEISSKNSANHIILQPIKSIAGAYSVYCTGYKLEEGNKATSWSRSPKDEVLALDVEYYLSDSSASTTGGSWSTTAPEWVDGKYMWSRQKLTYGDGTVETKNETCIAGAKGEDARKYVTLVTNDNLNDKRAKDTVYVTTSTAVCNSLQNKPTGFLAGECRVEIEWLGADTYLVQRLYCKSGTNSKIFHRTYYNGTWGSWLEDTSRSVSISPSAQVFKSTTGDVGPFEPQYIYIYPSFIGCTYSKWQYSTDGGSSWNDVTSGSNSLTIGTYNSIANTLRVERSSNLYTSSITALSFKCLSNFSDAYDTTTIIKVYDVTELQVGGRNYLYLSGENYSQIANGGYGCWNVGKVTWQHGIKLKPGETYTLSFYYSIEWNECTPIMPAFGIGAGSTPGSYSWDILHSVAYDSTQCEIYEKTSDNFPISGRVIKTFTFSDNNGSFPYLALRPYRSGNEHNLDGSKITVYNLKLEEGNVATAWTPAHEDILNDKPVIDGTQASATYNWTGVAPFDKLEDGQKITYWLPFSCGGSQVTMPYWSDAAGTTQQGTKNGSALNLTLADGTTTGNVACYFRGADRITSHFGAGYAIELTYKKLVKIGSYYYTGWWANGSYWENTIDNRLAYFAGKTGSIGVWATSLFMEDENGTYQNICTASDGTVTSSNRTTATTKKANTHGFKALSNVYFTNTTYAANSNINGWGVVYSSYGNLFDSRYSLNTTLTSGSLTAYKPVYLVGTIHNDGLFYLDTTWWTQTPTTTGKVYILIGACYDSTTSNCRIMLYEDNPWYIYKDSKLKQLTQSNLDDVKSIAQQAFDERVIRSSTEPQDPVEGMLWYDTTNDILYLYSSNQWRSQDMSLYASATDVETLKVNRNRTWIAQPVPPYNAGDTWVVQSGADKGKIKTCIQSRTSGSYSAGDWINPIDAYTTNTELTNVLGTDPKEWSSTSKSITTLINENTGEIEGQRKQISSLAVRASGIEMSFSRTGTMNFLGNSSGQNGLKGWTIDNSMINNIGAISASAASDVRQSLVSLSAFKMTFTSSLKSLTMTSALFTPPTSDVFTVSAKFKIPGKYAYVTFTINLYSDPDGQTLLGSRVMNVPYAVGAEDLFLLYHMSIDKSDFASVPQSARIVINGIQDTSDSVCLTTNPANDKGKIASAGKLYKYSSTYTYLKPVYKKITVDEFDHYLTASNLVGDKVYLCTKDMDKDSLSDNDYVRGVYYTIAENAIASSKKLKPINDSYTIMLLDSSREDPNDNSKAYYNITMNGTNENLETSSTNFTIGQYATIYVGDIMVNGGNNVQTWTPRQDENLWGENIKFDYSGITIENIPSGYKRIIDSNSDIAYQINDSGDIVKCIWKLTQDGFITNDIKCIGTFAMGYVTNEASSDLENTFTAVMEMKKNTDRDGVDEYLYVNS